MMYEGIQSVSNCIQKASVVKLNTWQIVQQDHSLEQLEHSVLKESCLSQEHGGGKVGGGGGGWLGLHVLNS